MIRVFLVKEPESATLVTSLGSFEAVYLQNIRLKFQPIRSRAREESIFIYCIVSGGLTINLY